MRPLLAVLTFLALLALASDARAAWLPPVPGPPARPFDLGSDPFAAGRHRGVDLTARPGERVRSACAGPVVFAGRVGGVGTVSVRCGRWRVSYLPLNALAVRAGQRVPAGRALGRVAGQRDRSAHPGLHLGVRREGRRFGYVDPLRLLARPASPPPPPPPAPRAQRRPPRLPARPAPRPIAAPRPVPAPRPVTARQAPAPWPVWLGLALLLTGLAGAGTVALPQRRTGGPRVTRRPLRAPR